MSPSPRMAFGRMLTVVALAAIALVGRSAHAAPFQQGTAAVMIQGFKFDPATLSVPVGTTVTWTNHDKAPHTATSVVDGKFNTGTIDPDGSKSVTLNEAGTFEYFCQIHPNMKATLTVTAAAPAPAPAPAADVVLGATLMGGSNEVPNPGDADGTGTSMVTLKASTGEVCWDTKAANITLPAAASHIHRGARGAAGPVVVPFTAPDASGVSSGCAKVDAALITEIAQNPAGFYVNVHTSDFPGGAVRGQLAVGAPAPAPAPPQLPVTGEAPTPVALPDTGMRDSTGMLAGLGLLILLAGLGLTWSARRRASGI